jgi:hypothetical protein
LHFRALDGSISAILLLWFQTFASVNPIWARTTAMELVLGCMLTGSRHVTQAIATTSPIQGGGLSGCCEAAQDQAYRHCTNIFLAEYSP